jgi:hypothetical protein
VACGWILVAKQETEQFYDTWLYRNDLLDKSNLEIYMFAIYWEFSTLTTVGYGDIAAKTKAEIDLSIIWMMFGVAFYSFVISTLTSTLVT